MTTSDTQFIKQPTKASSNWRWLLAAWMLVLLSGIGLRYGTAVMERDNIRDEYLMMVPVQDIIDQGWSVETAIDYQELKGPAFFWPYAAVGQLVNDDIRTMRLLSMTFYGLGALPILLMASRCGIRSWGLLAVAAFWIVLPYNATQGQLMMSEVSFVCVGAWAMWAFLWGVGDDNNSAHPITGPILTGILLCILLHNRPHAVAIAGAVGMTSLIALGRQCWPWWVACFVAGLARIPLYLRWGGVVTSDYQDLFAFAFDPAGVTYLVAAIVPSTGVLLVSVLARAELRAHWRFLVGGAAVGTGLGIFFQPDLAANIEYILPATSAEMSQPEYLGIIATLIRAAPGGAALEIAVMMLLSAMGGACLGAMACLLRAHSLKNSAGLATGLAFWTLALGLPLFTVTGGPVYDRYLQVWIILLPVVWVRWVPRWLLVFHGVMLAGILAYFVREHLL